MFKEKYIYLFICFLQGLLSLCEVESVWDDWNRWVTCCSVLSVSYITWHIASSDSTSFINSSYIKRLSLNTLVNPANWVPFLVWIVTVLLFNNQNFVAHWTLVTKLDTDRRSSVICWNKWQNSLSKTKWTWSSFEKKGNEDWIGTVDLVLQREGSVHYCVVVEQTKSKCLSPSECSSNVQSTVECLLLSVLNHRESYNQKYQFKFDKDNIRSWFSEIRSKVSICCCKKWTSFVNLLIFAFISHCLISNDVHFTLSTWLSIEGKR